MKKLIILILLCFPGFLLASMIRSNGPFYECEDLYLDPFRSILAIPTDSPNLIRYSLWNPIEKEYATLSYKKKALTRITTKWDGTTVLFVDSCSGFLTHYFHFLEHLLGIWQFGGAEQSQNVRHIVFCSQEEIKEQLSWKGVNQINEKLLKSLFPNAEISTLKEVKNQFKNSIHCEKMLISSRITSYKLPVCERINKMLGASWQDIAPFTMEQMRQRILSSLNITPLPQAKKPRITYVTRHPPRSLNSELENDLIQAIKSKIGVDVLKANFADMSFESQLRIIANTDVLIGVHGNGLSHIVFLPPTAIVFELFPSTGGFTWDYPLLAKIRNLDYYGHLADGWITSIEDPRYSQHLPNWNLNSPVEHLDIETIIKIIQEK